MKKTFLFVLAVVFLLSGIFFILVPASFSQINEVYLIKIEDDTINPVTAGYIVDSIEQAEKNGAECFIIELDTPGGLLTSTRQIVKKVLSANVPVVVYISPNGSRAGSAGVFITYASHIAAMAPSTNIGAAHPVQMGRGKQDKSLWEALKYLIDSFSKDKQRQVEKEDRDILENKILADTVAFIKALAKERNRNIDWAEASVVSSVSITAEEALANNVVEIIASDIQDLLAQLDGRQIIIKDTPKILNTKNVVLKYIDMNFRQRFLNVLANPNIAYILLILGFYGLLFEVTHPGIGFPGIAGAICIILAFFSLQTLPTNYAGLALIILAIVLFIAEVKVPGFGLLTFGGLVCMVLGSLLLFESPYQVMRVSLSLIIALTLATAGITLVLVRAVIISHKRKVVSGREGLISEKGEAKTDISKDKEGKVFVHGEIWNATSDESIAKGEKVEVVEVDGMILKVKNLKKGG